MLVPAVFYDLECDEPGCLTRLSETTDVSYESDGTAFDIARDYEWSIGDVGNVYGAGSHLCPEHARPSEPIQQNNSDSTKP